MESSASEVSLKLSKGCECKVSCFRTLDPLEVYKHRLNIAELTKNEQDFYVMGIVRAVMMNSKSETQRKRSSYTYLGRKVCLFAFLYLENITIYQLKKIRNHLKSNGVISIQHGNAHKTPHNAFPLGIYKNVSDFLRSYLNADKQNSKTIILNQPLSKVYRDYKKNEKSDKLMGYTTFRTFFKKQFPQVRLSNPLARSQQQSTSQQHLQLEEHLVEEMNTDDLIYYDDEISCDDGAIK